MTAALVLLVVWLFEVSLERAAVLAPVIVVAFGAAAAFIASVITAVLVTIVLGMTIAAHRAS